MTTRTTYSKKDSQHLISWVATKHPEKSKRNGNVMWKELINDPTARPWNERHPWQSWRDHYVKNSNHYDPLIEKHIIANNLPRSMPQPQSARRNPPKLSSQATQLSQLSPLRPSQSSVQQQEDIQDVENLAQYFADKSTKEDARQHAGTFQAMLSDASTAAWVSRRSGYQWRDLYRSNRDQIDTRVKDILNQGSAASNAVADTAINARKRPREDGTPAKTVNGTKRRRIEPIASDSAPQDAVVPSGVAQPEPESALPSKSRNRHEQDALTGGGGSAKNNRKPIVFVPETPPTSQPESKANTPQPTVAKPSGSYIEAFNHLPSPISPPALLPTAELPVQPSRARTQVSKSNSATPASEHRPARLNVPKLVSSALSMHSAFGTGQYGIEGSPVTIRSDLSSHGDQQTPKNDKGQTSRKKLSGPPVVNGKKNAGDIFPRFFPSLTPALRPEKRTQRPIEHTFPTGKKMHQEEAGAGQLTNGGNESTVVTSVEEEEVERDLVAEEQDQSSTLQKPAQQVLTPLNISQDPSHRYATKIAEGGNDEAVDEEDEEGPSPMPNMGSDRHSSRSFSFSHGLDDNQILHQDDVQDEAHNGDPEVEFVEPLEPEVGDGFGETIHDLGAVPRREPRYLIPRRHPRRPSESPLFASSDDAPSPEASINDLAKGEAIHYPLTTQNTAFGTFRNRSPRQSLDKTIALGDEGKSRATIRVEDADEDEDEVRHDNEIIELSDDDEDKNKENQAIPSMDQQAGSLLDTPDVPPPVETLNLMKNSPPQPGPPAKVINRGFTDALKAFKADRANRILAPFTVHPTSKVVKDPFLDSGSRKRPGEVGTSTLHYTAPNVSRHTEAKRQDAEEPSPSLQRAERLKRHSVGNGGIVVGEDEDSKRKKGRVRFDGNVIDRDRRKTTGGIGVSFGTKKRKEVASNPNSASPRFSDMFGAQDPEVQTTRAQMGIPSKEQASEGIIDLDSEKEDDESPLARYSMREAPSTEVTSSAARVNSMLGGRRSSIRNSPPPPAGIPVPIVPSSSPFSTISPIPTRHNISSNDIGTAHWSSLRFGRRSVSQGQAGSRMQRSSLASPNKEMDVDGFVQDQEIPSLDFRDQRRDAEWVASARGRPSVSTKRLRPSNRNAPIPSADDVIVYSSSPSRQPSRSRSQSNPRKRSDSTIRFTSTPISQDDQETIIKYLLERSLIEDDDEVDLETLRDGLAEIFKSIATSNGFDAGVPRNVWMQCGNIVKTGSIIQTMTDAANSEGLRRLKLEQKREMESRDEFLRESVDGRRMSGFSNLSRDASKRADQEEGDDEDEVVERTRLRARRSMDVRYSRPPSHVPAEVVEPLLNQ